MYKVFGHELLNKFTTDEGIFTITRESADKDLYTFIQTHLGGITKKTQHKNDIDNIDDINLPDIKLREVNTINGPSYNLLTDEELDWFKEKFGEQGINVL